MQPKGRSGGLRAPVAQTMGSAVEQTATRPRARALLRRHLLPLGLYLALALALTWPLALHLTTAIPSGDRDQWQNLWNLWWLKRALLTGQHPFFTTSIYHPTGASLYLHTLNPLNFLISLPVHAAFGLLAAYNFIVLFSLVLTGYATYLLAWDVTGDRRAALLAGVAFASSGYLLAQIAAGTMQLWPPGWIALAILALRRAVAAPSWRRSLLAGAALALLVLLDWYYLIFTLLFVGWWMLALLWQQRRLGALRPLALALAVAGVLILPLALPTARLASQTPRVEEQGGPDFHVQHSADVADFLIPSQRHPLWGQAASRAQWYKDDTDIQNKTLYLGAAALALAALAVRRRLGGFWLASGLIFALLALGPRLRLFGAITDVPLPQALLDQVPFLNIARYPFRYVVLTLLALALLAALGTRELLARLAKRGWSVRARDAVVAALAALIVFDQAVDLPLTAIDVPPIYAQLAVEPGDAAILEAPMQQRFSAIFMFYQAIHGRPLAGGYLSRDLRYPLQEQFPLIRMFVHAEPVVDIIDQDPRAVAPSLFSYFDIGFITIHDDGGAFRYAELQAVARAAAGGQKPERFALPREKGKGPFLLYRLRPPAEPQPFLGLGAGWSAPTVLSDTLARRAIQGQAELILYSQAERQLELELDLTASAAGTLSLRRTGRTLATIPLQPGAQTISLPVAAHAGELTLTLAPDAGLAVEVEKVRIKAR